MGRDQARSEHEDAYPCRAPIRELCNRKNEFPVQKQDAEQGNRTDNRLQHCSKRLSEKKQRSFNNIAVSSYRIQTHRKFAASGRSAFPTFDEGVQLRPPLSGSRWFLFAISLAGTMFLINYSRFRICISCTPCKNIYLPCALYNNKC